MTYIIFRPGSYSEISIKNDDADSIRNREAIKKTDTVIKISSQLRYFLLIMVCRHKYYYNPKYPGYSVTSQTVSELSAIDAPTRTLWIILVLFYTLLLIAFGWGIWLSAGHNKKLRFVAGIIIIDAVFGIFWPPMHQREVIAAGGGTLTDMLHLVWTYIHLVLVLLMISLGAAAMGKNFRIYSITTVVAFIVFGILTTRESPGIETGEPTPYIGIWERINMGAYMLWIAVFANALLRKQKIRNTLNRK